MNNRGANQLFMEQKLRSFEADSRHFVSRLQGTKTVQDLVRAIGMAPTPNSIISWMPEVSRQKASGRRAIEMQAKRVVGNEIKRLVTLQSEIPDAEFRKQLADFSRWLRQLGPHAPSVMRDAAREIHVRWVRSHAGDDDHPETNSSRGQLNGPTS